MLQLDVDHYYGMFLLNINYFYYYYYFFNVILTVLFPKFLTLQLKYADFPANAEKYKILWLPIQIC
jgi:hypothetical protein